MVVGATQERTKKVGKTQAGLRRAEEWHSTHYFGLLAYSLLLVVFHTHKAATRYRSGGNVECPRFCCTQVPTCSTRFLYMVS